MLVSKSTTTPCESCYHSILDTRSNVDNVDSEYEFLPLTAAEEIAFKDEVSGKIIIIMPPVSSTNSIQAAVDGVLFPPTAKVHLQFTDLILDMDTFPSQINLPWKNIRKILGFIRLLCEKFRVENNFEEQMPSEGNIGIGPPRPRFGSCFVPGDPLGEAKGYELDYEYYKRKSTQWAQAEKNFRRRSSRMEATDGEQTQLQLMESRLEEDDSDNDDEGTQRLSNQKTRLSTSLADSSRSLLVSPRRKKKSLFRELSSNNPNAMMLKSAWDAIIEGIRELCSGLRRACQVGSSICITSTSTDSLFQTLRNMSEKATYSCRELDLAKRLTTELVDVIKMLFTKRDKQQQFYSQYVTNDLFESEKAKVAQLEGEVRRLHQAGQLAKKEQEKLERQMVEAASILKADRQAVLEGEQLREAIADVEKMAEAVATMKFEVLDKELSTREAPTPVQQSLSVIAWMLQEYRKFLPTAILAENDVDDTDPSSPTSFRKPPHGIIALAFTNIQSSASLWESAPQSMQKAITAHNETLRRIIKENNGYEVKTIGDAFVVAFDTSIEACRFALSLQEELVNQDWDDDLLACPGIQVHPRFSSSSLQQLRAKNK
eukprot:TRINITY_DN10500_c0_g1_i1.p2 TRINITY_DN10500_c0_g1~~TRINITY_DN10500_c0_g1_i1.p2  ORF type:complete len:601 (+),score=127.47 TRINITY_DN10500_c0_g1_i1:2546-4348(+)